MLTTGKTSDVSRTSSITIVKSCVTTGRLEPLLLNTRTAVKIWLAASAAMDGKSKITIPWCTKLNHAKMRSHRPKRAGRIHQRNALEVSNAHTITPNMREGSRDDTLTNKQVRLPILFSLGSDTESEKHQSFIRTHIH